MVGKLYAYGQVARLPLLTPFTVGQHTLGLRLLCINAPPSLRKRYIHYTTTAVPAGAGWAVQSDA